MFALDFITCALAAGGNRELPAEGAPPGAPRAAGAAGPAGPGGAGLVVAGDKA